LINAFNQYSRELEVVPHLVLVKTGRADSSLEHACQQAGIAYDAYDFRGDYYALPNLLPMLSRPSRLDLLLDIMATPLPQRQPA
jgi:hypothetical protein